MDIQDRQDSENLEKEVFLLYSFILNILNIHVKQPKINIP